MYIKEVIIDGFKSYAHRTVVENFDPSFNAITGLNGSGKSNILDAICFVLGISVLSQVRVTSLQELIYKQGQAGVTKASVTIVFNNQDKSDGQCPIGYQQYDEITITRQIVMGGRNKYMINGRLAQHKTVQDLFQSVQLNVNNPHFLIMQGRITKVLNMKAPEILGLMEEAAGTRMFEMKKIQARKTMEKKDKKLQEINEVMSNEIAPKLERLEKQRTDYELFCKTQVDVAGLHRYVVAGTYASNKELEGKKRQDLQRNKARAEECHEEIRGVQTEQKRLTEDIRKLKEKLGKSKAASTAELEKAELQLSKELVHAQTVLENKRRDVVAEQRKLEEARAQREEGKAAIVAKEKERDQATKAFQTTAEKFENMKQQLTNANNQLQLLKSGVAAGDNGQSLTEQLMDLGKRTSQAKAEVKAHELRIKFLQKAIKEKQEASKKQDALYTSCKADLATAEKEVQGLQRQLQAIGYDATAAGTAQQQIDVLTRQSRALQQEVAIQEDRLSSLRFDYKDPWAGFDRSSVKGLVAKLIEVRDKAYSTAVEVTAGGRLYNVVVDTEKTGAALLTNGALKRRVTIIPLNKIQDHTVQPRVQSRVQALSGGTAELALELIGYRKEVEAAMKYVFGSTFVCQDGDMAANLAYHKEVYCRTVTLAGDEYRPDGTMAGGAKGNLGNTLLALQTLNDKRQELHAMQQQLEAAKGQFQGLNAGQQQFVAVQREADIKQALVEQLRQRLELSDQHQTQVEADKMAEELKELAAQIEQKQALIQKNEERMREIEAEARDFQGGHDKQQKVEAEIQKLKKAVEGLQPQLSQKQSAVQRVVLELEDLVREMKDEEKQDEERLAAINAAQADVQQLEGIVQTRQAAWAKAKEALDAANERLRQESEVLNRKQEEVDQCGQREEELNRELKGLDHSAVQLQREISGTVDYLARLVKENPWIPQHEHLFGVPGKEFDFSKRNLKDASKELEQMQNAQKERSKTVNKKALQMFENVQQEYTDLQVKKLQVEKDKGTIEKVIEELDQKKKSQLMETHAKVTRDLNSIFSTLLPGAQAELVAVKDDEDTLVGLEVKVGFNNQWKEGLSELSGGQRSLLALSLILALLLFKPAPMYILDEVDAALDLSHTQNIGKMLRAHFRDSQFIVVSLKEGMFNNANVVFRTKFVNGQSTVTRTLNS
eukprot:EG_transcript_864